MYHPLVTDISGHLNNICIAQGIILQSPCMIDSRRIHTNMFK